MLLSKPTTLKQYIFLSVLVLCSVAMSSLVNYFSFQKPRIAFVISSKLVEGYLGMKEGRIIFQNRSRAWQGNIDTLRFDFQKALSSYQKEAPTLSNPKRKEREAILARMQKNLQDYSSAIREKTRNEEDNLTQGILNQVNSFVKEYADQRGYEVVLGTTHAGSLLYGHDDLDITDELLSAMNKAYNPAMLESLKVSDTTKTVR